MIFEKGPHLLLNFGKNRLLAMPLTSILGVYPNENITPLPKPSEFSLGMANLEGRVVPIEDSIKKFGYTLGPEEDTYIILIQTHLGDVGLLVPSEFKVINISQKKIDQGLENYDEKKFSNLLKVNIDQENVIMINTHLPYKFGALDDQIFRLFAQSD